MQPLSFYMNGHMDSNHIWIYFQGFYIYYLDVFWKWFNSFNIEKEHNGRWILPGQFHVYMYYFDVYNYVHCIKTIHRTTPSSHISSSYITLSKLDTSTTFPTYSAQAMGHILVFTKQVSTTLILIRNHYITHIHSLNFRFYKHGSSFFSTFLFEWTHGF